MSEEQKAPETTETPPTNPSPLGDERMLASFCHLGGLIGMLFPPANVIIPLVLYLIYRDKYELVADQGKEAVNFQLSIMIYMIVSIILVFVAVGIPLVVAVAIFALVVSIIAALRARDGERYRYPLIIRFIP